MKTRIALFALAAVAAMAAAGLDNPSFEEIKDGVPAGWRINSSCIRAERGVGHNGSGGVVWESAEPSKGQASCVAEIDARPGIPYKFSCLVHTEKFEPGPRGTASICVE